jgi:hypothetical protein
MFRSRKTPSRIFINYRRGDAAGFAGRLSDALSGYFGDGRVFRDIDGIEGGANFEDVLKQTAQSADAMIVLIGRDWVTMTNKSGQRRLHEPDDWVAREIAAALERRIPVFPVLIEDAAMPRAEELPESLKPLVRHNAISISDNRWNSDVTRLAKIVAIDIPGSAAERILQWVRLVISIALFAAMFITTGIVAWNVAEKAKELKLHPLELWQSGVTFVVIVGSSMLLLVFAHLIDESKRWYVYAGGLVGLFGSCACFIWLGPLDDATEPIGMFFGSTVTATAVLILMNLSGFKAR